MKCTEGEIIKGRVAGPPLRVINDVMVQQVTLIDENLLSLLLPFASSTLFRPSSKMSERDPILPQNGSRRSRTSFLSNLSSRRSSKNLTVEEVHPNGDDSPAPLAPAAAVPASERTSLHDPRWAEENALGVKPNALARFRHT